jgi:hypothetical protein
MARMSPAGHSLRMCAWRAYIPTKHLGTCAPPTQSKPNLRYLLQFSGRRKPLYLEIVSQLQTIAAGQETIGNDFRTPFG